MRVESRRFGTIEVDDSKIIHLKEGLLGFPNSKRYIIADPPNADADLPFKYFVSMDEPDLCFLITDPGIFFADYVFELTAEQAATLEIKSQEDVAVISLLTVPEDPKQITANLRGPVIVNIHSRIGLQVVLDAPQFTTKHYIFRQDGPAREETTEGDESEASNVIRIHQAKSKGASAKAAQATAGI